MSIYAIAAFPLEVWHYKLKSLYMIIRNNDSSVVLCMDAASIDMGSNPYYELELLVKEIFCDVALSL